VDEERFDHDVKDATRLLVVADVGRSRKWYCTVLDADVFRSYEASCVLQVAGAWIVLVLGGPPTQDKPSVTFASPTNPDLVSAETIFRVPDCRAMYERLRARGADFLTPPIDNGAETRAFFRDPDGHLYEISEYRG
jgi:extradiol dioxygenase family protein